MTPWFKLWTNHLPVFEAAPDDALGRAIRAALVYCQTDQLPELDPLANLIFVTIQQDIDTAQNVCRSARENGKKSSSSRWKKQMENATEMGISGIESITNHTEKNISGSESITNHTQSIISDSESIANDTEAQEALEAQEAQEAPEGKDARKGAKKAPGRKAAPDWQSMMAEYPFSPAVREAILEWLRYKSERREPYRTQGLRSLLRQLDTSCQQYGDDAVVQLIGQCMASGWKGLIFDRLSTASPAKPSGTRQPDEQERQAIAMLMGQVE